LLSLPLFLSPPRNWLTLLEVLLAHLTLEHRVMVAAKLQLPTDSIERLQQLETAEATLMEHLPHDQHPSQIVQRLNQYEPDLLVLIAIRNGSKVNAGSANSAGIVIRQRLWRYLTQWSGVKACLDGRDLQALGYKPGPQFKQMLEALTAATLDGVVGDRTESEAFLKQHFSLP